MEKKTGKLYTSGNTTVLCTKDSNTNRFEGTVVGQKDKFSDHHIGFHTDGWTSKVFQLSEEPHILDNHYLKGYEEIGASQG